MKSIYLLIIALCIVIGCKTSYQTTQKSISVNTGEENIANGKRMTAMMCGPCHYDLSSKTYSGGIMHDVPKVLGKIVARNITQDTIIGVGKYTEAELWHLLKAGVSKDGRFIGFMLRPNIADSDLNDIIAFLKSNDSEVKATSINYGKSDLSLIGNMALSKGKPVPASNEIILKPGNQNKVELGRYLVDNLGCFDCHSKSFANLDKVNPEKSKGFMGGGNKMRTMDGSTILSSNLTFHETGMKGYSLKEFSSTLREGINKNNQIIRYPMRMYVELTDQECEAIYEYLKQIPAINNKVERS